jgi:hypothetical protein
MDLPMSNADAFQKRCQSLENAFFTDLDQRLLQGLQEKLSEEQSIQKLGEASGIQDQQALAAMHRMGVTPGAVSAVRVFPLIAIAWADGTADSKEAAAVRAIASKHVDSGSEASKLLEHWLANRPTPEMLEAWEACANALFSGVLGSESRKLKEGLIAEMEEVASVSGGLLGWFASTASESSTLHRIKHALGLAP